jgi:aspartyl-tRNA(Asn)/glutamyl-tRNA(Gln) amidotransferase subunit A
MSDILEHTLTDMRDALRRGDYTAVEAAQAFLEQAARCEPKLHAFLHLDAERVLRQAQEADARRARGEDAALLGVPIAVKDLLSTRGEPTTCASKMLEGYVPPFDATVIARLREQGAVLFGKTNLDEFAMGSSTESSAYGPTSNPWDLARVPGGSSGGSAAAVAAREVPAALGTDTGGSIRQPAAFCGITGLKPTYGRVSRYGLIAYASSLDQVGPMAKTARDCAVVLDAIAGHDPLDSTSAQVPAPSFESACAVPQEGVRLGLVQEFRAGLAPAMQAHLDAAVERLREAGATVVEVSLPHIEHALSAYYIVAPAEASSNLARFDGARYGHRTAGAPDVLRMFTRSRSEGFGDEVKRRIILGTYALSAGYYDAYYLKAQQVRTLLRQDFTQAFEHCDALLTPATPTPAFRLGENLADPVSMYLSDVYTVAVNLVGLPALVVPGGFEQGLPVGLQLIGKPFDEARLLALGVLWQQLTTFHESAPDLP